MTELDIIDTIYTSLVSNRSKSGIPIHLKGNPSFGTVQEDPFDMWIANEIIESLPEFLEVFKSGSLTTPDLVIRDGRSNTLVGLEIKTLIQKPNGSDSRGLTLDYNSSLPCGSTMIREGNDTVVIPCFYLFALLDNSSRYIVTLILMDGDFINYDFDLYKEAKYANYTEYGHGPYQEGSVRHRRMYTYPNPLNSRISEFHSRMILVAKKSDFNKLSTKFNPSEQIIRTDMHGNDFYYYLKDINEEKDRKSNTLLTLENIFDDCKKRKPKERTVAMPAIPPLN